MTPIMTPNRIKRLGDTWDERLLGYALARMKWHPYYSVLSGATPEQVKLYVETLDDRTQHAIRLRFQDEPLGVPAISAELGVSERRADALILKAIRRLTHYLYHAN